MVGGRADRTIRWVCLLCVGAVLTSVAMGEVVAVGALYSTVWRGKVRGEAVGGAWAGWSPWARIGAQCGPLRAPCGPLVGPLWAPCGPLVGSLWAPCGPLVGFSRSPPRQMLGGLAWGPYHLGDAAAPGGV
jgi:hypothetical protein